MEKVCRIRVERSRALVTGGWRGYWVVWHSRYREASALHRQDMDWSAHDVARQLFLNCMISELLLRRPPPLNYITESRNTLRP
jgi:hypothetical protein